MTKLRLTSSLVPTSSYLVPGRGSTTSSPRPPLYGDEGRGRNTRLKQRKLQHHSGTRFDALSAGLGRLSSVAGASR